MELEFDYHPYRQMDAVKLLLNSIKIYRQAYMNVILGITHSPACQTLKHDKNDWVKMIVKYQSNCLNNIDEIERNIQKKEVDLFKTEQNSCIRCLENRPYYFYVLLK
jgi:hypothetical protein